MKTLKTFEFKVEKDRRLVGKKALRFPVVSLSAEYLVIGYLMRRNILAYKAPPNNEGYDIICIHPEPRKVTKQVQVQVKSRYQSDCNRAVSVKAKSFDAFDFLIIAFLNIGCFSRRTAKKSAPMEPEFYTVPRDVARAHHRATKSGFDYIWTDSFDITPYKNERGFQLIAEALDIPMPSRSRGR